MSDKEITSSGLKFSFYETQMLRQGVEAFGYGSWRLILDNFPFKEGRKEMDLSERAQAMRLDCS